MALIKGFRPDSALAKGHVLISGRARQIDSSPTPSAPQADPNADPMQAAADQYEAEALRLSMAADERAAQRLKESTTAEPSDKS